MPNAPIAKIANYHSFNRETTNMLAKSRRKSPSEIPPPVDFRQRQESIVYVANYGTYVAIQADDLLSVTLGHTTNRRLHLRDGKPVPLINSRFSVVKPGDEILVSATPAADGGETWQKRCHVIEIKTTPGDPWGEIVCEWLSED